MGGGFGGLGGKGVRGRIGGLGGGGVGRGWRFPLGFLAGPALNDVGNSSDNRESFLRSSASIALLPKLLRVTLLVQAPQQAPELDVELFHVGH